MRRLGRETKSEEPRSQNPLVRDVINTITKGFVEERQTESARRKHLRAIQAAMNVGHALPNRPTPSIPITFSNKDLRGDDANQDDPMVTRAIIANFEVRRVLVDGGSLTDIIFIDAFN